MVKSCAVFSVKTAQASGPYMQALIKTISRVFDRVATRGNVGSMLNGSSSAEHHHHVAPEMVAAAAASART